MDISEDRDLNKVSDVELKLAKQQMDQEFQKHHLKPGDPQFVYDKQVCLCTCVCTPVALAARISAQHRSVARAAFPSNWEIRIEVGS